MSPAQARLVAAALTWMLLGAACCVAAIVLVIQGVLALPEVDFGKAGAAFGLACIGLVCVLPLRSLSRDLDRLDDERRQDPS